MKLLTKFTLFVLTGLTLNIELGTMNYCFAQTSACFSAATNYATGNLYEQTIVTADFNGDGFLDLAISAGHGDNIATTSPVVILLNNKSGTFTAGTSLPTSGQNTWGITSGDFNKDGKIDLAVASWRSSNVSVFIGNGNGTFAAAKTFTMSGSPIKIVSGDFNGDGNLDLATANYWGSNVGVLLGNGTGSFASAVYSSAANAGGHPWGIIGGDFNGDGKLDLAVTGTNVLLLGKGTGSFNAPVALAAGGSHIISTDFNADGKLDLATGNAVLLGNGTGGFAAPVYFASGSYGITSGDFNKDGKLDLATCDYGSTASVSSGTGTGSLAAPSNYTVGSKPSSIVAGDFNGDGFLDLAVANSGSQNVSVLLNKGAPATITAADTTTFCKGGSVILRANKGATSYLWSPGNSTADSIIVINSGNYSVKEYGTCTSNTITVTVNNFPNAKIIGKNKLCTKDSVTTLTASGGKKYLWNTNDTTAIITVKLTIDTTIYSVSVTDTNSCKKDTSIAIIVTASPKATITGATSICIGDSTTLTASGGDKYQWTTNTKDSIASIVVKPITDSIYKVTVSTGTCSDTTFVTVKLNTIPNANAGKDTATCKGISVTLNASGGASYLWTPATGLSDTTIANPKATPTTTTSYIVKVANGGCTRQDTIAVKVYSLPVVHGGQDVNISIGGSTTFAATGATAYLWTPTTALSSATAANPTANPETTTVYYVMGTDSNGCIGIDSVTVTVNSNCKEFFVPNAFSPNGNGFNDSLYVRGCAKEIKEINMAIYDRWGEQVFSTTNVTKGWDGTFNGKELNTAVFVFYIKATLLNGNEITQTGNISLIR